VLHHWLLEDKEKRDASIRAIANHTTHQRLNFVFIMATTAGRVCVYDKKKK
jgi:hypothetical protein